MHIRTFIVTDDGVFIGVADPPLAYFAYGKKAAREVLDELSVAGLNVETCRQDLEGVEPAEVQRPTVRVEGTFVTTLGDMVENVPGVGEGCVVVFPPLLDLGSQVFNLFTATENTDTGDALIGYCDDSQNHCIAIFFSKDQGLALLKSMQGWLPEEKLKKHTATIEESSLPPASDRQVIKIVGGIAKFINLSYAMGKIAARPKG